MIPTSEVVKALVAAVEASEREAVLRAKLAEARNTVDQMELMADVAAWAATAKRLRAAAVEKSKGWRA